MGLQRQPERTMGRLDLRPPPEGPVEPILSPNGGRRLLEPLLLSFAIASTGGFLDFTLRSDAIRFLALIEMLSVVTVGGGSVFALASATWATIRTVLDEQGG